MKDNSNSILGTGALRIHRVSRRAKRVVDRHEGVGLDIVNYYDPRLKEARLDMPS